MAEARKVAWTPEFFGTSASYTHLIPKLAGPIANGLISAHTVAHPYLDDTSEKVRFWAAKYKTRFNEDPDVFSVYGYLIADITLQTIQKVGPNLTTDAFIKTLDSTTFDADMFGGDKMVFTSTKHLGSNKSRMSQIKDGKWTVISEYVEP
jgi:branched-chain amino acid transport system substrate-binding protein